MNASLLEIDGAQGEGGGQILRSALTLAMSMGRSFRIRNIRVNRSRPGLLRQHATCVAAAAQISNARVVGGEVGSTELLFEPGDLAEALLTSADEFQFAVGSAGGTALVLQSILPALLTTSAAEELRLQISGGTHNIAAPSFEFLRHSYIPQLARIRIAHLARGIAEREAQAIRRRMARLAPELPCSCEIVECVDSPGPGNAITVELVSDLVSEVFSAVGQRGVRAERVVDRLCDEIAEYLHSDVPARVRIAIE